IRVYRGRSYPAIHTIVLGDADRRQGPKYWQEFAATVYRDADPKDAFPIGIPNPDHTLFHRALKLHCSPNVAESAIGSPKMYGIQVGDQPLDHLDSVPTP